MTRPFARPLVVALSALAALTLLAGPAAASSHHHRHTSGHHSKSALHKKAKKPAKKPKYVAFALGGTLTAVDAGRVTLTVAVRKHHSTTRVPVAMVVSSSAQARRNGTKVAVDGVR